MIIQKRSAGTKPQKGWHSSAIPAWLDEGTYLGQMVRFSVALDGYDLFLSSTLGVSEPYAADIRAGRHRPHPRHWGALAQSAAVSD
jgi:hypothetical protein